MKFYKLTYSKDRLTVYTTPQLTKARALTKGVELLEMGYEVKLDAVH